MSALCNLAIESSPTANGSPPAVEAAHTILAASGSFAEWLLFTFVGLEADGLETAQFLPAYFCELLPI